jgi:hypothetical protein
MRNLIIFPVLLIAVSRLRNATAFRPLIRPTTISKRRSVIAPVSLQTVELEERHRVQAPRRSVHGIDGEKQDPSALTFSGQILKTSRPLVPLADKQCLIDFFKSDKARNTLFVSDTPPVPITPIPEKLFREWQTEARKLRVVVPSREAASQQTVMQLCSNGISFSGLHVETTVFCGSKLIEHDDSTGLPVYELTMITDKTQARGPKVLMWIYNQVMGTVASSSTNSDAKTTTSLCRISLVEKQGGVAVSFESTFQVKTKFPRFLLKVLPVSKARAEQQGSSAVTSFVQKGVLESLQRFETAFAATSRLAP